MDYTETPHAEDFAMEIGEFIEEYYRRGLSIENMMKILEDTFEEYKTDEEYV
jgi:DNA-binding transcriptional regulator YhcF (GntR family)